MSDDKKKQAYNEAVKRGEAAPIKAYDEATKRTIRNIQSFIDESSFNGHVPRSGTRAEFIKRLIEATQRYGFVEVCKPDGLEDLCWYEINQAHPIGELANTYEEREEPRIVETGPRPTAYREEGGKTIIVPEPPKFEMWVIYVKDVNC